MTIEQRKAIKRICEDYDFENAKELKSWMKENDCGILDEYWFNGSTEEECYTELKVLVDINAFYETFCQGRKS